MRVDWKNAFPNDDGIKKIGVQYHNAKTNIARVVGFNGILEGTEVLYKEEVYIVVVASRDGYFGLSKDGVAPYTIKASPKEVIRHEG